MQKTTKAVVVGLSVLLAAGIFASCNKSGGAGANVDKELAKEFKGYKAQKSPDKKAYDFGGMEVIIANWWDSQTGSLTVEAKSPQQELEQRFHNYVNQMYNMHVDVYGIDGWGEHPTTIANFCTTGGDENYVFVADGRSIGAGIKANLYYDLSKVTAIDWSNKKWDDASKVKTTKGKGFYGMRPIKSEPRDGVFFNKRILSEANIDPESLYDMQKNGTWTWDAFEEVLKTVVRDIDNDGVIDVWGMAQNSKEFCVSAALSNGGAFIYKDSNGDFANGFGTEKTIEAMLWVQKMTTNYAQPQPEGSNWDFFYSSFLNGEIAFLVDQEYVVDRLADMEDDWGFVCFPLGPSGDQVYKNFSDDWVFVVPAVYGDERAQKVAKAFDLFMDEIPGVGEDDWKNDYYVLFRDERAVDETLQLMRDTATPNLMPMISGLGDAGAYIWNVYPGAITPQEAYETTKNEYDTLIAEQNK